MNQKRTLLTGVAVGTAAVALIAGLFWTRDRRSDPPAVSPSGIHPTDFDTNKDGKLDPEEMERLQEARRGWREKVMSEMKGRRAVEGNTNGTNEVVPH